VVGATSSEGFLLKKSLTAYGYVNIVRPTFTFISVKGKINNMMNTSAKLDSVR